MAVKITVTQDAKPLDVPPLKVVITINRELTEKPIEYVIENKYSTDKMFDLSFSTKSGIFQEMKTGTAPENFYLNILGQNGAKIQRQLILFRQSEQIRRSLKDWFGMMT